MIKIIDSDKERSSLSEGRTQGIAFAFAKRNENHFKLVMPITSCKDYLNDLVFGEKYKIPKTNVVYGFSHEYCGLFENDSPYLVMTVVNNLNNSWSDYDKYYNKMVKEINKIVAYVNSIEKKLNYNFTEVIKARGKYILKLDQRWVSDPKMISLYTLLLRCQLHYTGHGIIKDYSSIPKKIIQSHYINKLKENLEDLIEGKPINYRSKSTNISTVHSSGILNSTLCKK